MKLGFVGVGKIATSVIEGIFKAKINVKEIILSPKNRKNSKFLQNKFKKIKIAKNNQEVLDKSNWVVLSITPKIGKQILKNLKFKKNHIILNFMSTIHNSELKRIIFPAKKIFKVAPLPMIKYNLGPIIIYPKNKSIEKFFSRLGEVFSTNDEKENKKLWVMTSFMATYLEIFNTAAKWLQNKNINKIKSIKYLSNLFKGLNHELSVNYKPNNDKLIISGVQGNFKVNNTIHATSTNAVYNIASFDSSPIKLAQITVEPDPINAEPEDDYGFTTTITEWPYTET
ncbi:MAG: hypothetical protein EBU44_00855 [Proteobacteria bacterium]|nr:hypothetical protein [Pseudomonadota bacterium]